MRTPPTITASSGTGFNLIIGNDATRTTTAFAAAEIRVTSARLGPSASGMTIGMGGYLSTIVNEFLELIAEL
jgi:hypothetical protein